MNLNRWRWNKPKSYYLSLEVNNIDDVKQLILAYLWVVIDINHLLKRVSRSELPPAPHSSLYMDGYSTHASS